MQLYLLVVIGMLAHLALKLRDAWSKKEEFDIKKQLIWSALGLPIILTIVYLKSSLTGFIDITPVVAFFLGYFADSAIKNIEAYGRKKINP